MENEPTEEQRKQQKADFMAVDRLATKFVTECLNDVMDKGKCDLTAEVTVKVTVKLTKPNQEEK